jgi:hypothetical protein
MNTNIDSESDSSPWEALSRIAEASLPGDLSRRVLESAAYVRRRRRETLAITVTLFICLIGTGSGIGWWQYEQREQSLTSWQELAAVSQSIDRGL